jgi:nucleoside-diphosphate-sugar epimerase
MKTNSKHIILGAGGAIGQSLADQLISNGESVKLVSRNARPIQGAEVFKADLTDSGQVNNAVEKSSIVYLLAGLRYSISVWREQWPRIMRNTVEACEAKNAKLIFFDNVYPYGEVEGKMTEATPVNPCSKKGEVRAGIAEYLLSEVAGKKIEALIARSADFYGPYANKTSPPFILIIERLAKGKRAMPLGDVNAFHSYTYTLDCARALCLLAKRESAFNQVWHLPTATPPLTGKQFMQLVADKLGTSVKYIALTRAFLKLGGLFTEQLREVGEMMYQSERDYVFDSSKFENHFGFKPTPYETGVEQTIAHFRRIGVI